MNDYSPFKLIFLTLLFFFSPLTAWAYFDPGFGGYLINSVISLVVTGTAFISAAVIYFFRTIIGQKLFCFCQKHEKTCLIVLLSVLSVGSFFLGSFFHSTFHKPSGPYSHFSGVHIINPQRMSEGYNLYDGILIDNKGRIVKQWAMANYGILDNNGDFYAKLNGHHPTWGRYTWNDQVIWEKHFSIDHGIYLPAKGSVVVFTEEPHSYNNYQVNFDVILEFDKNGRQLQRYAFWDHLKEYQPYHAEFNIDSSFPAPFGFLKFFMEKRKLYDYFHLNFFSIIPPNPLEGKNPAFRPGNWLISLLNGSMVFILDQDTKKILWHMAANDVQGGLQGQHSVSMLPDGNILLFENGADRKVSRILMIDPLTLKIKWQYDHLYFTPLNGFVQALPNGNILVTESRKGHVIELTPDKEIAWDFYKSETSTHHLDPEVKIYFMIRYPKKMIDPLLRN